MAQRKVLGIDLACRSWADNGTAVLSFEAGDAPVWSECHSGVIQWPAAPLHPRAMALALDEFVVKNGISAVSLDGPQGWRDPNAGNRRGVGRWCEYEARTPGKTGEFRTTYPRNYLGWVSFSIDVFRELDALGRATLVNDPDLQAELPWLDAGRYYILECFPTSTWRASGLDPLPGHRRAPQNVVQNYAGLLQGRYDLPAGAITNHHDNLQAIVAPQSLGALARPLGGV